MKIRKFILIAFSITLSIPMAQADWRSYSSINNTPATGRAALGSYRSPANYSNPTNYGQRNYSQTGVYNDRYNAEGYYGNKPYTNNSTQSTSYRPYQYRPSQYRNDGMINTNTQSGFSGTANRNINW